MSVLVLLAPMGVIPLYAQEAESGEEVDVSEIIFGHVGDSYEWHITSWKDKSIAIHLPVIVHSRTTGWHVFSSKRLEHGEQYKGLHIDQESGKIVESDGSRPFDISITKNVLSLMMSGVLLLVIILLTARWYKKHDGEREAPRGIAAFMEPLVMMVHEEVLALSVHGVLLHSAEQLPRDNTFLPGRSQPHRKHRHHTCPRSVHILHGEYLRNQTLLQGDIQSRCPCLPEADNARH